jgi:hypothetical protein
MNTDLPFADVFMTGPVLGRSPEYSVKVLAQTYCDVGSALGLAFVTLQELCALQSIAAGRPGAPL